MTCCICTDIAKFGFLEDIKPSFCYKHRHLGMVNFTSQECLECTRESIYGYPLESFPSYCVRHKAKGMVN